MQLQQQVVDANGYEIDGVSGATVTLGANFDAIQNYAVGKTIDEIEATASGENAVDAVSGATLVDTAGYLATILAAAQAINSCAAALFCAPGKNPSKKPARAAGASGRVKAQYSSCRPSRAFI